MNNHFHRFLSGTCLVVLGATGFPSFAQQVSQPASPGVVAGTANAQEARGEAVVGYSADQVSVMTQTLADGTTITHKSLSRVYRDSQGRSRYENYGTRADSGGPEDSPQSISIFDPAAGVSYYLNPRDHTAQRHEVRKPSPSPGARAANPSANLGPARPAMPRPIREDLGTQVIEGLEARGQRITRTIPEGAEGNDRPMQMTSESWIAAKEGIVLLQISNDPRRGERVMHLTNLVLEEPPANLFQVPPDYTLEELRPVAKPEPPSD